MGRAPALTPAAHAEARVAVLWRRRLPGRRGPVSRGRRSQASCLSCHGGGHRSPGLRLFRVPLRNQSPLKVPTTIDAPAGREAELRAVPPAPECHRANAAEQPSNLPRRRVSHSSPARSPCMRRVHLRSGFPSARSTARPATGCASSSSTRRRANRSTARRAFRCWPCSAATDGAGGGEDLGVDQHRPSVIDH
jgi:hypothetical protein